MKSKFNGKNTTHKLSPRQIADTHIGLSDYRVEKFRRRFRILLAVPDDLDNLDGTYSWVTIGVANTRQAARHLIDKHIEDKFSRWISSIG